MRDSEARLQGAADSFKGLFTTQKTGLRLTLVAGLFALGLTFLFSPRLFESFKSFTIIVPIPEWPFGCVLLLFSVWLAFSSRGQSRRLALAACGLWWLFWSIVNELGAGLFTPGTAIYLVLWLLSSLELYREFARVKEGDASPTELQWVFTARANGLRLSSAVLGFFVGLPLIINPDTFEGTPSYIALRPYPEWAFGLVFWVLSAFQMLSKRGWARRSSLLFSAGQWVFWSTFIFISTKTINTGNSCYFGVALLTFYEFYREIRERADKVTDDK